VLLSFVVSCIYNRVLTMVVGWQGVVPTYIAEGVRIVPLSHQVVVVHLARIVSGQLAGSRGC